MKDDLHQKNRPLRNESRSIRITRTHIVILIVFVSLMLWVQQQGNFREASRALTEAKARLIALEQQISDANEEFDLLNREQKSEKLKHHETVAAIADLEPEVAKTDPESLWTTPPTSLPLWDTNSPYIWLKKEVLPRLSVKVFTDHGELHRDIAGFLDLQDPKTLNSKLSKLVSDYRALEVANAEPMGEHLSGIEKVEGKKITLRIKPLPEEGARLKQQFETELQNELGEQRSNLIMQLASSWFGENLSGFGSQEKILSVGQNRDGKYSISIKSGDSRMSASGSRELNYYIPSHFLPLIHEALQRPSPEDSTAQTP